MNHDRKMPPCCPTHGPCTPVVPPTAKRVLDLIETNDFSGVEEIVRSLYPDAAGRGWSAAVSAVKNSIAFLQQRGLIRTVYAPVYMEISEARQVWQNEKQNAELSEKVNP